MKTPEDIYDEAKERRERTARLRRALEALGQTTKPQIIPGIINLALGGFMIWSILQFYYSDEPMTKSDGAVLGIYGVIMGYAFMQAHSFLTINPKDAVLRDLIEAKLEAEMDAKI